MRLMLTPGPTVYTPTHSRPPQQPRSKLGGGVSRARPPCGAPCSGAQAGHACPSPPLPRMQQLDRGLSLKHCATCVRRPLNQLWFLIFFLQVQSSRGDRHPTGGRRPGALIFQIPFLWYSRFMVHRQRARLRTTKSYLVTPLIRWKTRQLRYSGIACR